jgi:hypothetical protein
LDRRPLLAANSVKWRSRKIDQSLGNVVHVLHDVRDALKNVAAYASAESPERIIGLINDLSEMEGRNGNLRGVLFELLAAYLARRDAVSIDMGVRARDPETGNFADIDVLKVTHKSVSVTCIECKGKEPGGRVRLEDVKTCLRKTAIMRAHLLAHTSFRESEHRFELWTFGKFDKDALAHLAEAVRLRLPGIVLPPIQYCFTRSFAESSIDWMHRPQIERVGSLVMSSGRVQAPNPLSPPG